MSTLWRTVQAAVAIVLLGAGVGETQEVPRGLAEVSDDTRAGFWVGLGVGAGGESFDPRDGSGYSPELYRPTISLRLGGTVSQHFRLGGEALAWIDEEGDAVHSLSSFLLIGQFYPVSNAGLYLKGGAGLGRSAVDFEDGFGLGDTGFAGLLGAGWELRVGRGLYLNPAVDLVEHRYTARGGERYRERLVNFGLGVLFQSAR